MYLGRACLDETLTFTQQQCMYCSIVIRYIQLSHVYSVYEAIPSYGHMHVAISYTQKGNGPLGLLVLTASKCM